MRLRASTILEVLLYIALAGVIITLTLPLMNQILTRTVFYQQKVTLRNDFSRLIHRLEYEAASSDRFDFLPDWGILGETNGSLTGLRWAQPNLIDTATVTGYAWSYQAGGISLADTTYRLQRTVANNCVISATSTIVSTYQYSGYAWSPQIGWISFRNAPNETPYGVCEEVSGNLRGFAWNDVVGWLVFNCLDNNACQVSSHQVQQVANRLVGYAWNEVLGWIRFDGSGGQVWQLDSGQETRLTHSATRVSQFTFTEQASSTRAVIQVQAGGRTMTGTTTLTPLRR